MFKKLAIGLALVAGFALVNTPEASAWPYRRIAPVRRVVAPPYPVARAAVVGPRYYRPYYARPYVAAPYVTGYRGPAYYGGYGPGVSGGIYFGF